ncbi:hypothetical protein [Bradyrhizobium sp. SRS-191]|uniref:hypothetical protein n=1 Tax=Bradyrhizobium sp. SRS-191 TaxID=2962606 RepID=UPI00211ED7D3|nr:hypothetical protein [Bradyrhizobium sp. SRS-191]
MSGQYHKVSAQAQQQSQQKHEQQQQQQQHGGAPTPPDHVALIALTIATLGRQLEDLAQLEGDAARQDAVRSASAEIVKHAMDIVAPDRLYITVPPGWKPPSALEPCPDCSHLRSKGKKP